MAAPGVVALVYGGIGRVRKVRFFKSPCDSKGRFHGTSRRPLCVCAGGGGAHGNQQPHMHAARPTPDPNGPRPTVTIGHETAMATVQFFGGGPTAASSLGGGGGGFDLDSEYPWLDSLPDADEAWALVQFDTPVPCPPACIFIASRLDADLRTAGRGEPRGPTAGERACSHLITGPGGGPDVVEPESNRCRLAFHGTMVRAFADPQYTTTVLPHLRVYKIKHREGHVDRVVDSHYLLGRGLFKRETNMARFLGLTVRLSTGTRRRPAPADTYGVTDGAVSQTFARSSYVGAWQAPPARSTRRSARAASLKCTLRAGYRRTWPSCWQQGARGPNSRARRSPAPATQASCS